MEEEEEVGQTKTQIVRVGNRQKKTMTMSQPEKQVKKIKLEKFKKGVINPLMDSLQEYSYQFEGEDKVVKDDCCVLCTSKELGRLLRTEQYTLFDKLIKQKHKVGCLNQRYRDIKDSVVDLSPLEELLVKKDSKGLDHYLNAMNKEVKKEIHFAQKQESSLQTVNTGYNDQRAYGYFTRRVEMSRGGRQGNQAFLQDQD